MMASVQFRPPYSPEELAKLYPSGLRLEHVQVILRHGERTPTGPRFQNAGLAAHWPYCNAARRFKDVLMSNEKASEWDELEFKRQIETIGPKDAPALVRAANGLVDGLCQPGELTDTGRATTLQLGTRLRHLYVDQLKFLPDALSDPASTVVLRATPIIRAQQSVEQAFLGLYPRYQRTQNCPGPTVITRSWQDETLFPNTGACRRLKEMFDGYATRAAQTWNDSEEMDYINKKIGKWMPEESKRVKVDGRPRLSGIMDTTNSTIAHPNSAKTRLPSEFYDEKVRASVDKMVSDEWFRGYRESQEYRTLAMGSSLGDMTSRMIWHVEGRDAEGNTPRSNRESDLQGRPKLWMAGAHDTSLAGIMSSLGAFGSSPWPPYTSHVAIELFSDASEAPKQPPGWLSWLTGSSTSAPARSLATKPTATYTQPERELLRKHYVRVRYNDVPAVIPGCAREGRHLEGDATFCTLEAFREIVEAFAPTDLRRQCLANLGKGLPETPERAGWAKGQQQQPEAQEGLQ